ncbi:conserved hypothetical protein [Arthrobacter sp. 9AX]|uniref:DUF1003 domain-containing protein n=1 Tax=Arthrobacter sp. 9AX TaxID=2653131 RepID=UPI0012F0F6A0|nr:DUF1003 domain-containing protein [Arthrobacter sp. 9AX]VXC23279.1 conserved hypothetical protein [Arthrobacter sp. 9AX]
MSERRSTWHARHKEGLNRGERAADVLRNGMGSWTFVGLFIAFMAGWAMVNSFVLASEAAWDPYPYILLNLFLSMLAGLQGAILLIAAKRQDAIAAAMARHDYETDVQSKLEIDRLMAINSQQLELLEELRSMLSQPAAVEPGGLPPDTRLQGDAIGRDHSGNAEQPGASG